MRLWEDTVLRAPLRGKPPELPNLPKRVSVDDLCSNRVLMAVKRAWRKLRRPVA